jgi:3-hydroxyisobutyrate dehydrogenase-like beta-hydroxyacid dehydrogenase
MRVGVLGLGEAGSLMASDLALAGDEVHGYDPVEMTAPGSVTLHRDAGASIHGCDLVLALTPGSRAQEALEGALDSIGEGSVYADLSTCAPATKIALAEIVEGRGALFADVALMSPVPGRGLGTPSLVSGTGADRYAAEINARGGNVVVVGPDAGEAATRKLLRSVLMKGLAAVLIESMEAAEGAGKAVWYWGHVVEEMTALDEEMVRRLIFDTAPHARRRIDEMEAAHDLLVDLGVPPTMTDATIAGLRRLAADGMPPLGVD